MCEFTPIDGDAFTTQNQWNLAFTITETFLRNNLIATHIHPKIKSFCNADWFEIEYADRSTNPDDLIEVANSAPDPV